MTRVFDFLGRTPVLLASLVAMVALGAALRAASAYAGPLLDFVYSGDAAAAQIAGMTAAQRSAHAWATGVLDTLYPLAYGGLFAGLAARFGGTWRGLAPLPMLAGIVFDYAENAVQVAALNGVSGVIAAKSVLTPVKFGLVYAGIAIGLGALLIAGARRLMTPKP